MYLGANVTRYGVKQSGTGFVDSGACYPGCSQANISACQPVEFQNESDFDSYSAMHGEIPVLLGTAVPNSPEWNALRAQAFSNCFAQSPAVAAPAPVYYGSPIVEGAGPGAGPVGTGITLQQATMTPSSVAQPGTSAPTFVTGAGPSAPLDTGGPQQTMTTAPSGGDNTLLYAGLAVLAIILAGGRRGGA